LQNFSHF
jgi:serine/threonine protein kinase